eukprot:XP_019926205.1 PREDICTED: uncharacterized protein LOC105336315 isoform X2 [Crassostrea gigas]
MDADKDTYQFHPERTHQGLALVIANFTEGEDRREGADSDLKYMKKTFKRLGFKVDCHENVTKSDLDSLLNGYSGQKLLTSYDCFVFAISSHGMEFVQRDKMGNSVHQHAIKTFDDQFVYTSDILDHFNDTNCKALKNKPKLFFIQACRIPHTKATKTKRIKGIGFDSGVHLPSGGDEHDQRTVGDQTDFDGSTCETDTDSDSESDDVSDTDVEEDESSLFDIEITARGHEEGEKIWQNLEKRQAEILKKLNRMENQVWLLGREYKVAAKENKEQEKKGPRSPIVGNSQTAAYENKKPSLHDNEELKSQNAASENDEEPCPHDSADEIEKPKPQYSPEVTADHEDDIDPAKGQTIYFTNTSAPVEFTLVPCHNDMLIMFASPQGHYAFRRKTDGSYMLRLLYESVEKYYVNGRLTGNHTNFLDVLRDVTTWMSKTKFMGSKEYTIVSCVVHKLRKDVIFTHGKNMSRTKFTIKPCDLE